MMLFEDQIEEYKVKVKVEKDGKEEEEEEEKCVCYKIRGLKSNDEILKWSKFCASVFAYKANPPPASYFERHYINDPYKEDKPSLIRVATIQNQHQEDEEIIVGSCRLFLRTISSPTTTSGGGGGGGGTGLVSSSFLSAGGIGEVCTDPKHRRRGLSKILLQNCISIMKERKLQLSLLHAAPTFFDVYEKTGGYKCTQSSWSTIEINYNNLLLLLLSNSSSSSSIMIKGGGGGGKEEEKYYSIRQAKFPNDSETLLKLHQRYSEQRFAGCIVRNIDYWNNYLSQELGDSLLVLCYEEEIVGWLSIRPRGENRIQLREFGLDENNHQMITNTAKVLTILLSSAMNQMESTHKQENFVLSLPTFVINQVRRRGDDGMEEKDIDKKTQQCFLWPTLKSDDDMGWMYKILDDQVVDFNMIDGTNTPHLIWPSDSF